MVREKTFILGLGHQKCGTTWLHKYLCQSAGFAEGHTKEYHVWDRVDIPLFRNERTKLSLRTLLNPAQLRSYRMENSASYYFDYFDNLLKKDKFLTADITPSYSGLRRERLEMIRRNLLLRKIGVKVVILVREPLSRIKSAVRFNLDRRYYHEGITPNETIFEEALSQYYKSEHCAMRTKYENIISEAENIFGPEEIYVGFFENMFSENEIRRISEFLKVSPNFEFARVRVNKTKGSVKATQIDSSIREHYYTTYKYFHERFPVTRELWS